MSDAPLLLPSAKEPRAPARAPRSHLLLRVALGILGALLVLYGAADLVSRAAHVSFGMNANMVAFGPAITSLESSATTSTVSTTSIVPARLTIPAIGIDAKVESVGNDKNGAMKTPSTFHTVAWYNLGSKPGQSGNAVIAGHVNNALTKVGVFEHLDALKVGDTIRVADAAGKTLNFTVRDIEDYSADQAPTDVIFSRSGKSQLVLVTCAGDWDPKAHSYDHRLVVFASLAQ
jgi:sortase A